MDESFSYLVGRTIESAGHLVTKHPNLVVIKSLSKDFGIAGVRLGYAVMSEKRVSALLERGYLWNVSGFGEYVLDLLNRKDFLKKYEKTRRKAIRERDAFFRELSGIHGITVYPSRANMFLIELLDGTKASDLLVRLLFRHGIYVRACCDKVGLVGEFVRIASRTAKENKGLIHALKVSLSE
ncbi:MAG: aminotransferase class I/II-fold pyridoxal phosphate-dependent enzyme [Patescibacteria group bacterium]